MKAHLILMALLIPCVCWASSSPEGDAFANSIAPTSPSQVVNPGGVNWGSGSGTVPTVVPSGMGGFSAPVTDGSLYNQAKTFGLLSMGNQTMADCANYVPGSGDAYRDQQCAAVNFLANNCLSPTPGQQTILGKTSSGVTPGTNCAGSYGAGKNQFGYDAQIKPTDPIFDPFRNITTSPDTSCTTQQVSTTPARHQSSTCLKTTDSTVNHCSQYLNVAVTTTTTRSSTKIVCPDGATLNGNTCQVTEVTPGTPIYTCQAGDVVSWNKCQKTTTVPPSGSFCPAHVNNSFFVRGTHNNIFLGMHSGKCRYMVDSTGHTGGFSAAGAQQCVYLYNDSHYVNDVVCNPSVNCPAGTTLQNNTCTTTTTYDASISGYTCPPGSTLDGVVCKTIIDSPPIVKEYCEDGGTPQDKTCTKKVAQPSWVSTCLPYEQAAGSPLDTP